MILKRALKPETRVLRNGGNGGNKTKTSICRSRRYEFFFDLEQFIAMDQEHSIVAMNL